MLANKNMSTMRTFNDAAERYKFSERPLEDWRKSSSVCLSCKHAWLMSYVKYSDSSNTLRMNVNCERLGKGVQDIVTFCSLRENQTDQQAASRAANFSIVSE
jgi:hypothetical protein